MYSPCSAYAERILSHTEHTRTEFNHMLSILGTDFIACWACAEMFKSRISRPNRIRFSKISCYRPLGPFGFGFCKKSLKKISCLCTFNPYRKVKRQVKVLIRNLAIFFLCPSKQFLPISFQIQLLEYFSQKRMNKGISSRVQWFWLFSHFEV